MLKSNENQQSALPRSEQGPETTYKLEQVDLENRTGVLKLRPADKKKWIKINVALSPLLSVSIHDERQLKRLRPGDKFVGTEFTSTLTSKRFEKNPFNLVKFVPVEGSDIPENYLLRRVDEKLNGYTEISDAFGNKVRRYSNYMKNVHQFIRHEVVETRAMMKDVKAHKGFNYITP